MLPRLVLSLLALFLGIVPLRAEPRIKVVASFSILADFVANVGDESVDLITLVGPNGDAHVYDPTPADARKVADARLVVINGLGLEGWMPRLVQSSGSRASVLAATAGITPLKLGAESDPHAWQAVANARIYVANIRDALAAADPEHAGVFQTRAAAYLDKLDALDREVRAAIAKIPPERRIAITTHNAFGYFAAEYGMRFVALMGVSTETEPSARDIAATIGQIRAAKIPAVFLEHRSDDRLIRRIAAESGAKVGGTLFSDSLTDEKGEAPTYIDMVRHNIKALTSALDQ